jgi:hypothetical protein
VALVDVGVIGLLGAYVPSLALLPEAVDSPPSDCGAPCVSNVFWRLRRYHVDNIDEYAHEAVARC